MSEETQQLGTYLLDRSNSRLTRMLAHNDIMFAIGLGMVLATLLIPLPTFMLDMMLSISIAVAVATMVVVLSTEEPIQFSAFPSLLLFVTLFRLSLNVASTRLILLQGDAGRIIATFGHFVVGGNMVIGLVVFLILVIIQFVVITKGAERISEVAARFNLDAMPGKQMAIDADLNAGLIGERDAKYRREKIVAESEFYGSMDGASKFIRGDAIAGLVITAVNLIGGFLIGITRGMTPAESVSTYSILAVGDGLVTQIPAIVIATSAGFLISKSSSHQSLSQELVRQFLARSRPLGVAAFLFAAMVFVPNFPKVPFVVLALGTGLLSRALARLEQQSRQAARKSEQKEESEEQPVEELLDVDTLSVQVGPRLIQTVDPRRKGSLSQRIKPLRRKFAEQYGIVLPLVRLRDNVSLDPNVYQIRLYNHVVAEGRLEPDKLLAMDPGTVQKRVDGQAAEEPVFNLPALWISRDKKDEAEMAGYTVVDPETVMVTHLSETLRRHAHELLSRDDVQQLVDRLRAKQPALVDTVVGDLVPLGLLHRVLQRLLADGIPIRDLKQILETLGDHAAQTKDPVALTERVRKAIARAITEQHRNAQGCLEAITLDTSLEYDLRSKASQDADGLSVDPNRALALIQRIADVWKEAMAAGHDKVVLLCDSRIRPHLAAMLSRQIPQLPVLAYDEIETGSNVQTVGTVTLETEATASAASLKASN
ncbi:MAG: flagellar biosynthesis protein FlhA [Phycisphaerae bacterium]